ncbi:ImmA/IrrE family metallo-endopeptidase [Candidatus Uhrbacteria bacterium]|nr:ImmA/IrrE family metallo-endopeptidase [Candidatus Uhrbacteria bacterium]
MEGLTEKIRVILEKLAITQPPIDIEKVAAYFGINLVPYDNFPDNVSGMIVRDQNGDNENIYIGFNSKQAKVRQRFTVAHELGHFLSGHDDLKIVEDTFDKDTVKEREANSLAAELLMPKDFLVADMKLGKYDIPSLASRYGVSEQAMSICLLKSGLLSKV